MQRAEVYHHWSHLLNIDTDLLIHRCRAYMNSNRGWLEYSAGEMLCRYTNDQSTERAVDKYIEKNNTNTDCDLICFTAISRMYRIHTVVLGENTVWGTAERQQNQTDADYINQADSVWYFFGQCNYKPGYRRPTAIAHDNHPKIELDTEDCALDLSVWNPMPLLHEIRSHDAINDSDLSPPHIYLEETHDQDQAENIDDAPARNTRSKYQAENTLPSGENSSNQAENTTRNKENTSNQAEKDSDTPGTKQNTLQLRKSNRIRGLQPEIPENRERPPESSNADSSQDVPVQNLPRRSERLKPNQNKPPEPQPSTSKEDQQIQEPTKDEDNEDSSSSDNLDYEEATPPKKKTTKNYRKGKIPKCPKRDADGMYKCRYCTHTTKFPSRWKIHTYTHFEKRFSCNEPGCNRSFKVQGDRDRHHYNFHQDPSKLSCSQCDYSSVSRKLLLHHEKSHEKKLKCPKCHYFSNDKSNMNKHYRKNHA
jgi:hypothetical protein